MMIFKFSALRKISFHATLITAILLIMQLFCPVNLYPQTGPDLFDRGFLNNSRRILDYQFDRADRELSPDRWMEEARRGLMNTRAVWAEIAPEIFLDSGALAALDEWSAEELENRFTRWLLERFFGAGIEAPASALFRETSEADKYLLYHTGPGGNILYDPGTGDPIIIRPGDEGHDFTEDLLSWQKITGDAAEREAQAYRLNIIENYPEILACISPGSEEGFLKKIFAAGDGAVHALKHEFEATLAREERYFTAQRLGDVWSLRRKSEGKSAEAIGLSLIEEARLACDEGIASIEARIESAKGEGVDLALAGAQWLDEFRQQFDRGLEAWESAEERFLIRRLEWEYSAETAFYEGLEAWNAAYARFEKERRNWEEQARILLLEGEQFFAQASEALEKAISAAREEFERESVIRIGAASDRAGALANMYILSSSVAKEAKKNIDFWTWKYKDIAGAVTVPGEIEALESWIDGKLLLYVDADESLDKFILEELRTWIALYRSYAEKTETCRQDLIQELYSLNGIDSHEAELLRAEGELDYWRHRSEMAEAVVAYATALDAGRTTAAESAEAWEKARIAHYEAALIYGEAEASLMSAGDEIYAARDALKKAAEEMKAADAALEMLRRNYQTLTAVMGNRGSIMLAEELAFYNQELTALRELLERYDEDSCWGIFLGYAMEMETRQFEEYRKAILYQLIAGDGDALLSLSNLAAKETSPAGEEALSAFTAALLEGNFISAEQYELLIAFMDESSASWAENQLDLRLAAISLIIENDSLATWYSSVYEKMRGEAAIAEIPLIEQQLLSDLEIAGLDLLIARIELELRVLDFLDTGDAAGNEDAAVFAVLYAGDETNRLQDRLLLERMLALLGPLAADRTKIISAGGLQNILIEASLENLDMMPFFAGYSIINAQYGQEIYRILLYDYVRNEEFCAELYNVFSGLAILAPATVSENIDRGFMQLSKLWETLDVNAEDSVIPDTSRIIGALKELDENFMAAIPAIVHILDEIFDSFPSWLGLSYFQWKDSLIQYCALQTEEALLVAESQTNILNAAFLLLKNKTAASFDYETEAARYLSDPLLEWNERSFIPEDIGVYEEYIGAMDELQLLYSKENFLRDEINRLAPLVELSGKEREELDEELANLIAEITLAEENGKVSGAAYLEAAEGFKYAGESYDAFFTAAERAFKKLENARRAFEIQDAVRLWAETAYLNSKKPADELRYCSDRAVFAMNALEMLRNLEPEGNRSSEFIDACMRFEENFSFYTLSLAAFYEYERALEAERRANESVYLDYQEQLALLGKSFSLEKGYTSPGDVELWSIRDMITVEDGILVFSRGGDNVLSGCDEERTEILIEYFTRNIIIDGEAFPVSAFELALRDLADSLFMLPDPQYMNFGLARDHLIKQIFDSNPDISALYAEGTGSWLKTADALRDGNLANMAIGSDGKTKVREKAAEFEASVANRQQDAWDSLDEKTKKDLEFYTILILLGGGGNNAGYFTQVSEYYEYRAALDYANSSLRTINNKMKIPFIGWAFVSDYERLKHTTVALSTPFKELEARIKHGQESLLEMLFYLKIKFLAYEESSGRLAVIESINSETACWDDIKRAFTLMEYFNTDLAHLETVWDSLSEEITAEVKDVSGALKLMADVCMDRKDESLKTMALIWNEGEEERESNEAAYRELYNAYLAGNADLKDLQVIAALSFGGIVPLEKEYFDYVGTILMKNLAGFTERSLDGTPEQSILSGDYTALIVNAWEGKYSAELTIRENEWDLQRRDIQEKLIRWQDLAAAILERGRIAWKDTDGKLHEACNAWVKAFQEEYGRISDQWTAAYLEGLLDKEAWAAAALEAASQASSDAVIALVGSDAEAGARAMDTRDPLGFMNLPDLYEGERIMADLLEKSGVGYLTAAFGKIQGSRESLATVVRTGIGGGAWNSGMVMNEALALARTVHEEFEERESLKLAYMVMNTAREAYKMLEANILAANDNFKNQMDETFIMNGQWRRSGADYSKDVVVHSTFFSPVITERAEVEGYRYFRLPNTQLSGYPYDDLPGNLNVFQAETLVDTIYAEINELVRKIFGAEGSDGEYQLYIGIQPVFKESGDIDLDGGKAGLFEDFGTGELGRLLEEFYYWMAMEQQGIAMMDLAPWDKPMWDSRGSWLEAPSLRSTVNLAIQTGVIIAGAAGAAFSGGGSFIGAVAISAAINSADDFVFAALDLAGGYKSWSEVGVEFGKNVLTNTVSAAAGSLFNGVSGSASAFLGSGGVSGIFSEGIGGALWSGLSTGAQVFTSGTINSVINSVTYSDHGGFGFSVDSFLEGLKQSAISAASFSAGSFATGIMNLGLNGFVDDLLKDGSKLSTLTGGLVSQGVNYAFGNDFTLNIFNIGLITGLFTDKEINAGLLELHLGRDGMSLQLGSGGADVSAGTLWSALKGTEAFLVNLELLASRQEATGKYAKYLRSLYSRDATTREEYENVLAGTTKYVEWGLDFTESHFADGVKTVYLGTNAQNDSSDLGLSVVFAHEAYRDGKSGTEEEQIIERNDAVLGHILMAAAIMNSYGEGSISESDANDVRAFSYALNNNIAQAIEFIENFDTSADYWRLLKDGNLINDNSGWLTYEDGKPVFNADGKQIGATGIETGLLNILYGGTSGMAYSSFSDSQISLAQELMILAGMNFTEGADGSIRSRAWNGNAKGLALNMGSVMTYAGDTIAAQVFARYYDASIDFVISKILGKDIGHIIRNTVPELAIERHADLFASKLNFYGAAQSFVDDSLGYYISYSFGVEDQKHYESYLHKHYGFDLGRLGGSLGDPLYAGIQGVITKANWNYDSNGNSIQIEYGYQFEDNFIGSGIYGEYLHMKEETEFQIGTFLQASTQIGQIAGTPDYTPHLHYDILTQNGNYSTTMLAMLLGKNAALTSFKSKNKVNTVYNPLFYYNNFLGLTLYTKEEYLAQMNK